MYTHKCPKCGKFTGANMTYAHWAFGQSSGMEYIYCDVVCYEAMEFPYFIQERNQHDE